MKTQVEKYTIDLCLDLKLRKFIKNLSIQEKRRFAVFLYFSISINKRYFIIW